MSDSSSVLSDSMSEREIFDHSLSMWREKRPSSGTDEFHFKMEDEFEPLELDIHTQCCIGNYENVREAVKNQSVELDRKNRGGWSPLMYACYTGHESIVTLLIEAGVNLNMTNHKLITPLMLASSCGNEGIVKVLVELGAHKDAVDHRGWSALFHATFSGQQVIVKYLLDCGVDMNLREHTNGMTALMEAAQAGHEGIVQCFLNKGVDTRVKSKSGTTALTYAMLRAHCNIVHAIQHYNHKRGTFKSQESPKSILKQSNALLEGPEAVKKLMKKLAFKDEQPIDQHQKNLATVTPQQQTTTDTTYNTIPTTPTTNLTTPPQQPSSSLPRGDAYTTTSTTTTQQTNTLPPTTTPPLATASTPPTLQQLLQQLGLSKYCPIFQEQDVDLAIFLTLNDHDLKEIGINLLGPRKKMLMAISRWHNNNNNSNNRYNNNSSNNNRVNNVINPNMHLPAEQEIRDFVLSLDMKRQELEQQVRREAQVRVTMETRLMQERTHYHAVLLNAGNLLSRYKTNSDVLFMNMRKCIVTLSNQLEGGIHASSQPTSQSMHISHLIGQDLANQMLDGEGSDQSNEGLVSLKRACGELELASTLLFERLSSTLVPPHNN